jgi:WD40 repeat protein
MQRMFRFALTVGLLALGTTVLAQPQDDRRERKEPGLILETPGRMAACDVLTFVHEGKDLYLLAAGDDKVVIVWQVDGNKLVEKKRLRWGIYREQRGSIYALTTFRGPDKKLKVAIGGWGREPGQIAVIDFDTGAVNHVLEPQIGNKLAVWSLAASPAGDQVAWGTGDGTVWVWQPGEKMAAPLGGLPPGKREPLNRAHFVTYVGERRLVSSTHDGRVVEWDTLRPHDKPRELFAFDMKKVAQAVLSPDRKWLAARGDSRNVEIRSFPGGHEKKEIGPLPEGHVPQSVAFDRDSQRLAVGVGVRAISESSPFLYTLNGEVQLYDLRGAHPQKTGGRLEMTLFADAMAFDPNGKRLAVAGGDNHEVVLWDMAREKPPPALPTPGHSLWGAALSADGKQLGVKDRRHGTSAPKSPNHAATGDYHVFDLGTGKGRRRDWTTAKDFHPVEAVETLDGWSVHFDPNDFMRWEAVGPDKKHHELVLNRAYDDLPRCYTFIEPAAKGKPIRLAVGHYWGVSLYEMDAGKAGPFHRTRLYVGHQGYVTSLAPSADHKMLVSASRDMTVNCWSLADWPSQPEVGVKLKVDGKKLVVEEVDPGSPAWQAGLGKGTELELLASGDPKGPRLAGEAEGWLKKFQNARPAEEFICLYKPQGAPGAKVTVFTARQRPVWRFFPTFAAGADGKSVPQEWVIWRWQDYFYDASTHGDSYVGWQISGDPADPPLFHPAERFRTRFLKTDAVRKTLDRQASDPEHVQFRDIEPPKVAVKPAAAAVNNADTSVTVEALRVQRVGAPLLQNLLRVEVWLNDRYLVKMLTVADFKGGELPAVPVAISANDMQSGLNTVKVIAINNAEGRGEAVTNFTFTAPNRPAKRILYALVVGISDYSKTKPQQDDLEGASDAKAVSQLWAAQGRSQLYENVRLRKPLLNADATPEAILKELNDLAKIVKPDDQFVMFLAGHGSAKEAAKAGEYEPGTFFYLGPRFDFNKAAATSLSSKDLYLALANLRCHQLLLLDACHSGDVASNPLQDLRRNGVGAVVLAACKNSQSAYELRGKKHGVFMTALEEAMGEDFKADRNRDGVIGPSELAQYVIERVPQLLHEVDKTLSQDPQVSPWADELSAYKRPLAKKPQADTRGGTPRR